MRSEAASVDEYLGTLPDERREALEAVREVVLANLPDGYVETMNWGMISYEVPLETYPDTYNGKPLMYAGLASQKHHMALYLTGMDAMEGERAAFEAAYAATGKKLDMGRSCLRFTRLDDLALDVIAAGIAAVTPEDLVDHFEETRPRRG